MATAAARTRSLVGGAVRWLDGYTLWAMNPAPLPARGDAGSRDQQDLAIAGQRDGQLVAEPSR